jgi:radical SAM protein with 4Fe4S-binding SPASM domain
MAVTTSQINKKDKINIKFFLKKILNYLMPNLLIFKLMENSFTHFGMEISNACNANCSFCAYRFMTRKLSIMSNENTEKAVAEFNNLGGGTVSFTPVVGDPLVDKNLINKIKICSNQKNIKEIFLYTNGIFIHRFDLKKLLQSGLTRIAISTYVGNAEKYKKYYGKNHYSQVIENIINLSKLNNELGKPINITLHLRVDLPKDKWQENPDFIQISKLVGQENISWLETYENWSGKIEADDIPEGCTLSEIVSIDEKKKSPCFEMYRRIHVLSDGAVGVCSCRDIDAEINIGDLNKQNLKELWTGGKLKSYRDNWKQGILPDICKNCDRYQPVNEYISKNKLNIFLTHLRRIKKRMKA